MIKNVIFDFDGTLVDSNEAVISSLRETHKKFFNTYPDESLIKKILGKSLDSQIKGIGIENNLDEAFEYYRNHYREVRDEKTFEYQGIRKMLDNLNSMGIKMIIVSNKGKNGLDHGLKKFGYENYFDMVVGKDDVLFNKPDPNAFNIVKKEFGGNCNDYIIVGDSTSDIEFGKNCSVKTVLVSWTLIPIEEFVDNKPDFIISNPEELIDIIKRL
jgi:pyrophosphatase PpaX